MSIRFGYMLVKEGVGKIECQPTHVDKPVAPADPVFDCDPNSTFIH
jgi:hypothetical protein